MVTPDTPYHSLAEAPVSVLGTVACARRRLPFHGLRGPAGPCLAARPIALWPGSHHYDTSPAYTLGRDDCPALPAQKRQKPPSDLAQTALNINRLPIPRLVLEVGLGPANPQMTTIAEEPWFFRRPGFSPGFDATKRGILVRRRSTRALARASAQRPCLTTPTSLNWWVRYRWLVLAPSICDARTLDR